MGIYEIEGVVPVVHPTAFVHPEAVLIGDVLIGAGCYVGPLASLRGDFGQVVVSAGANVQDGCVLHCFPGRDVVVEQDGHVGHGAVLHGCHVGRGVLVGMNSVVMDGATIGDFSFVGACSFVRAETEVPERHLVAGNPARVLRELSDVELAWKANGTGVYQDLARRSHARPPSRRAPVRPGGEPTPSQHRPRRRGAPPGVPAVLIADRPVGRPGVQLVPALVKSRIAPPRPSGQRGEGKERAGEEEGDVGDRRNDAGVLSALVSRVARISASP